MFINNIQNHKPPDRLDKAEAFYTGRTYCDNHSYYNHKYITA